ncbi:hypothetical protein M407DRAFT_67741 [Tulasnella calospora MUT 4182]|uniref:GED domain-containing protein n=1 Tax=Tulasnella calospora MUT 4182 TaxID=1051891 RepID=A0A0C3LCE2_9AGAM|nr:hypothetical protein M407DRAFT_67741 [Tulasnella calospora MUT 4182]
MSDYFKRRRDLLDILKDLHSTGIQNELDLPQIVVIGSQSVGKSSLIESMSGLTLPRDTGTCTRCPMECRLQYADTWSCKIFLRFHVDSTGTPLPHMREIPFGPTLFNTEDVERMLRRAQRAILRPDLDPSSFLDDSDLHVFGIPLTFSGNCVCVRVEGPNVPDLYFYDLPGKLVEELAKSYITKPNCIVLLVISCETDFENQGAGRLVLKDPALRQRTVGVLTKVDRVEYGASSKWVRILRGEENPLLHGWYCVKQPDLVQMQEGVSWEEARAAEAEFFTTVSPWADLERSHRARIGSGKLANRLGVILSDLVSEELPGIRKTVAAELSAISTKLRSMVPPRFEDPRKVVITLLRDFNKTISKHIEGLPPSVSPADPTDTTLTGLIHSLNQAFERFREKVHQTAPQFRPWSSIQAVEQTLEQEMLDSAKQDDDAVGLGSTNSLHVDQVMDLAKRSRTRELPGNYPFSVKENLIVESVRQWGALANECFEEVQEIVSRHVDRLIDGHFQKFAPGGLKEEVRLMTQQQIRECAAATIEKIEGLYRSERCPYTQNDHYFFAYRSKMLQRYKLIHQQSLSKSHLITAMRAHNPSEARGMDENQWNYLNQAITALQNFGISPVKAEDFAKLLPEDDLSPALEIMAEVRAYFQVAYKRFGDNVPKQIDADFVRGIDTGLDVALMTMDLSKDKCMEYLQEPVAVVTERRELTGKQERLEAAQQKLSRFYDEQGTYSQSPSGRKTQTAIFRRIVILKCVNGNVLQKCNL